MRKKVFLFSIGLITGFLLLVSLSGTVSAQSFSCSDRGGFCGTIRGLEETVDCCAGVCTTDGDCQCLIGCCSLVSELGGDRGDPCYCQGECRYGATCTGGICCDNRWDYVKDRDGGEECWCHEECLSGQCIGGVCVAVSTCRPAGCACTSSGVCRGVGGVINNSLTCPDPSDFCCCFDDDNGGGGSPPPSPPPNGCSIRGRECDSTPCCTGLLCKETFTGAYIGFDHVCCDPTKDFPDGDFCYCRDECLNNNCIKYYCGGPPPAPPAVCGNGVRELGEGCDDGNTVSGDGCSDTCISERAATGELGGFKIGGDGEIINLQSPLGCTTIEECISRMINFLFSLAIILAPLMMILAGFLYITAAGKPEKIAEAQKLITWTLIGFLIVSLARAIVYVITSVIGG